MKCKQCGREHNRKKFCSNKCKDRWHNIVNPRGMFAKSDEDEYGNRDNHWLSQYAVEDGWDGHKNAF